MEITTYCLDKEGKVVFEKDYPAVLISEYSFMGDNQPLAWRGTFYSLRVN